MAGEPRDELLDLYARELSYLRERGAEFSAAYPKVAARLGISGPHVADPHVERLLEAFAFLTARIQQGIERDLPELTTSLLGVLYPQVNSPVPSMAIAAFAIDPSESKLTSGYTIDRHTPLFAEAAGGTTCRFRTCYPVTLWPIKLAGAAIVAPEVIDAPVSVKGVAAALRLRIESTGPTLAELGIKRLRFFLSGGGLTVHRLYELLFASAVAVFAAGGEGGRAVYPASLRPVGFEADEDAIPYPPHAHRGYRLIQEYFAFPEKFLFFDVELSGLPPEREADLVILLDQRPSKSVTVRDDTFRLGCTPIVNIFPKSTEPIRVDHRTSEYRLLGDVRRERVTEIHSIVEVSATAPAEGEPRVYEPFFSFAHRAPGLAPRAFWHARRVPTGRADVPGTDVLLSFVDLDFTPRAPPSDVVYGRVLCTNRDLAEEMSAGVALQIERGAAVARATCLTKPTPELRPPLGGQALWRLVSNLSLNHLSLSGGPEGVEALREILRVYLFSDAPEVERQIAGIARMSSRIVTRRIGDLAFRGFCRGTEVTLTLDEERFVGSNPILFASVLSRFLSLYAHLNAFTELVIKSSSREEVWKRWPPMAGERALL